MTTHLIAFATEDMRRAAALCESSARAHGVDSVSLCVPAECEVEKYKNVRGFGYWQWKPRIILALLNNHSAFTQLDDGDILIYSDAGVEFINSVNYIIDRMDQDIFLFGNQYEHAHWCKRDIIEAIWPWRVSDDTVEFTFNLSQRTWERFGKQVQASVIFFRVNDKTRAFVKEWLEWCLYGVTTYTEPVGGYSFPKAVHYLIDDSPSIAPNHPEFQENRHDQAILTTMAYRDGIPLHWWPAQYNGGAFEYPHGDYPDEGYPILFHHHRRRNHEWEQVA